MAENNFVVTSSGGQEYRTGLIVPDQIPLTFAEYPAGEVLELAQIKHIHKNPKRKMATDRYRRRKNQGRRSSCAAYACTTTGEVRRSFDRKADVEFGPEWLYSLINGGADGGALLDHAMLAFNGLNPKTRKPMAGYGCCLRTSVPYEVHNLSSMSMEQKRFAAQEAEDYRGLEWSKMPHGNLAACWEATCSAIATRNPCLLAVHCDRGFFDCDSQGRCRVDRGPGNHAVCGVDLLNVETARSFRDLEIVVINSHGSRFGNNGCYRHTYDHMAEPCRYHEHCANHAMRTSPSESISTLLG